MADGRWQMADNDRWPVPGRLLLACLVVKEPACGRLPAFADLREERLAELRGLPLADAVDVAQRLGSGRLEPGHLAQRRVVEDDVGRHPTSPGDLQPQGAQVLEQDA